MGISFFLLPFFYYEKGKDKIVHTRKKPTNNVICNPINHHNSTKGIWRCKFSQQVHVGGNTNGLLTRVIHVKCKNRCRIINCLSLHFKTFPYTKFCYFFYKNICVFCLRNYMHSLLNNFVKYCDVILFKKKMCIVNNSMIQLF